MLQKQPPSIGTLVSVRGDHWRVINRTRHDDCEAWQLEGIRPSNRGDRQTLLVPFDRPSPLPEGPGEGRRVGRRRGMLALRGLLAASVGAGQLRAAAAARMDVLDYQLEPALACLRGASRILIADEVGLGKTVQAGLVLTELASRGEAARALVLAPGSLCEQWAEELQVRFGLEPAVVDAAALRRVTAWSSPEEGPWNRLPLAIASIDYVKQPEVLRGMAAVRWDLLVVDEAHGCAQARYRGAAATWLAERARRLVLLTATPHAGDEDGFRALCAIGRFPGEPPITMFRRTRADLGGPPTRKVHLLRVRPGEAEARMHAALLSYAAAVWRTARAPGETEAARLAVLVLCKRAASGVPALLSSLTRRLGCLAVPALVRVQLSLPLAVEDPDREDEPPGDVLQPPGLDDPEEERRLLRNLIGLAGEACGAATKTAALARLLARAREPAIVFTEYRDTLEHLASRLAPGGSCAVLHGGLDRAARREAVARFTSGAARLLLATDAASHGLNLHAACRLVINHDLPWSPSRLEQRIGRVDRIGQRRMVHAVHLAALGTFEDRVLGRLALRVEAVRRSIGLGSSPLGKVAERDVAETVLGIQELPGDTVPIRPRVLAASEGTDASCAVNACFLAGDLRAEAREEGRRLRTVRAWSRVRGREDPAVATAGCLGTAPWRFAVRADRSGLAPGLYALYRIQVSDLRGAPVEECLLPLFLPARAMHPTPGAAELRPQVLAALQSVALTEATRRVARVHASTRPAIDAQRWRESRMAAVEAREPDPVQPGLFDRRALKAAGEAVDRRRALAAEAAARLAALDAAMRPALVSPPELLIALLAARGRRPRCW